jgi:hypothetical protein
VLLDLLPHLGLFEIIYFFPVMDRLPATPVEVPFTDEAATFTTPLLPGSMRPPYEEPLFLHPFEEHAPQLDPLSTSVVSPFSFSIYSAASSASAGSAGAVPPSIASATGSAASTALAYSAPPSAGAARIPSPLSVAGASVALPFLVQHTSTAMATSAQLASSAQFTLRSPTHVQNTPLLNDRAQAPHSLPGSSLLSLSPLLAHTQQQQHFVEQPLSHPRAHLSPPQPPLSLPQALPRSQSLHQHHAHHHGVPLQPQPGSQPLLTQHPSFSRRHHHQQRTQPHSLPGQYPTATSHTASMHIHSPREFQTVSPSAVASLSAGTRAMAGLLPGGELAGSHDVVHGSSTPSSAASAAAAAEKTAARLPSGASSRATDHSAQYAHSPVDPVAVVGDGRSTGMMSDMDTMQMMIRSAALAQQSNPALTHQEPDSATQALMNALRPPLQPLPSGGGGASAELSATAMHTSSGTASPGITPRPSVAAASAAAPPASEKAAAEETLVTPSDDDSGSGSPVLDLHAPPESLANGLPAQPLRPQVLHFSPSSRRPQQQSQQASPAAENAQRVEASGPIAPVASARSLRLSGTPAQEESAPLFPYHEPDLSEHSDESLGDVVREAVGWSGGGVGVC